MKSLLLILLFVGNLLFGSVAIMNGLSHQFSVTPGNKYRGQIELQNADEVDQVVTFYQADMVTKFTGEILYDDTMKHHRSNRHWISISNLNMNIGSGEKRILNFEITVPESDSLTGTYWSVIMVEPRDPIHIQKDEVSGYNIQSKIRYAIQIVCNIGDTGNANLQFLGVSKNFTEEQKLLEIDIENTGEILIIPTLNIEFFDESGSDAGVLKSEQQRIFPSCSKKYVIDISSLPMKKLQGIVIADCGTDDLFGVNVTIDLKNDD